MSATHRSRLERIAILFWVVVAVGIAARLVFGSNPYRGNVYLKVYAAAADAFVQGRPLYDASGFRYPPLVAAVFVPFSMCGPVLGSVLWRAANFAVLWAGVQAVFRARLPLELGSRERGVFLLLVVLYNITSLNNGQVNPLILGCLLLATAAILRSAYARAGHAVVVATLFKVYPLAYGLVLAALRPRVIVWIITGLVLAALVPFLLQSSDYLTAEHRSLFGVLSHEDRTIDLANAYRDIRLVLAASGVTLSATLFTVLRVVTGCGIVAVCLAVRHRTHEPSRVLEYAFSLTMFWLMLFGPATEKATYGLVAPSVTWPLIAAWRDGRKGWLWVWGAVHALILVDHSPVMISRAYQGAHPWVRCFQAYAVILATGALLTRAARE